MNKNDDDGLLDIAIEVFKQTLQDFTSSYWNWVIVKRPTNEDIRVCASSYEWLLNGYIACVFYSEEERINIINEAVKRCHMGYTYDRKHGFIKTKKVRKRVSV